MKFTVAWGIALSVVLFLTGCANPSVSVELLNRTGGVCKGVYLDGVNRYAENLGGCFPNGGSGMEGMWPYPMPPKATLSWTTESNAYSIPLTLPVVTNRHPDFIEYYFVILPNGRAKVAATAWSSSTYAGPEREFRQFPIASQTDVELGIKIENDLCRDGGPDYRVGVKNKTGVKIEDVGVKFGSYTVNGGSMLNNTDEDSNIAVGLPYPVTDSASLHWVTQDGHSWDKVLDMAKILPLNLDRKCFFFVLKENGNAEVQIVDWNDLRAGKHPDLRSGW